MMKVSKTLTTALRQLLAGEPVAASRLKGDMADTLMAEGLLTVKAQGSRRTLRAIDINALRLFLESRYEGLRGFVGGMDTTGREITTRHEQAVATGNSKLVKVRSCPGFPVNSYEPIECRLHGKKFWVNPADGSFLFIDDWNTFSVPKDVVVVGIENMENFRMIRRQRALFESHIGNRRFIFVSRYPQSTDLRKWLQTITNQYIHFGDFDLAGIHIFLTEFHRYLGDRSSFFVPSDIEQRLAQGSSERYNGQYAKFHELHCEEQNLQMLVDLINRYRRCYDQEGYI